MLANAIGLSEKFVSERHAIASQTKFTAGEAAAKLSKLMDQKISAKQLVEGFTLINGMEPEWHHSGFYKPQTGKRKIMGRTFFFTEKQIDEIAHEWFVVSEKILDREKEIERKKETMIYGFYFSWTHDYSGNYGKKRNYKVLKIYEGPEISKPNNFTACSPGELLSVKLAGAQKYYGWDEPSLSEFENISKIKYNRILKARIEAKAAAEKVEVERKIQWAKDQEIIRIQYLEKQKADAIIKAETNPTNFVPCQAEIDVIKNWVKNECKHPVPEDLGKLKERSGLTWSQFELLAKEKWSGWHW